MLTPFVQDVDLTIHVGDALEVLRTLPDESAHCCVTSPPYFQQRDYGTDGQIGLETSPDAFVERLVAVFGELRRVLRSDGVLWLNIGDSYAANRSYQVSQTKHKTHDYGRSNAAMVPDGLKPKDLIGVPWLLAFALRADGWWLRSENIWWKTNALPESATDRPHRGHEHVFQLTRSAQYAYDSEVVKVPAAWERWGAQTPRKTNDSRARGAQFVKERTRQGVLEIAGERNLRSVWPIQTQPFGEAHFAVMPEAVVEPCILSSSPPGGVVLDPFLGSGTTALVARRLGRRCIGIELSESYAALAADRTRQLSLLAGEASA